MILIQLLLFGEILFALVILCFCVVDTIRHD